MVVALQWDEGGLGAGGCPLPPDLEARRLAATRECRELDTAAEARFARIIDLCVAVFKVPIAVVGLIDDDHLAFKAATGTTLPVARRLHSFCQASLAAARPTMMIVEDTLQDARFQHNEFVSGPPYVRFYGGAPLISSEGYVMGSLGMMDLVPRQMEAGSLQVLCNLAELVVRELERDKAEALRLQREAELAAGQQRRSLVRALSAFSQAVALCDLGGGSDGKDWRVLFANEAWGRLTGAPAPSSKDAEQQPPAAFWDVLCCPEGSAGLAQALTLARIATSQSQPFALRLLVAGGGASSSSSSSGGRQLGVSFRPAANDSLGEGTPLPGIPSFVPSSALAGTGQDGAASSWYFAVVQEPEPELSGGSVERPGTPQGAVSRGPFSSSSEQPSASSTPLSTLSGGSCVACYGMRLPGQLAGLQLGQLLGSGSFGRVFRGNWGGGQVAVKVLETWVSESDCVTDQGGAPAPRRGPLLEALLSSRLQHPQVVRTLQYVIDESPPDSPCQEEPGLQILPGFNAANDARSMHSGPSTQSGPSPSGPRHLMRVWQLQQLCNRGTLLDALERGWLRQRPSLDGPTDVLAVLQTAQDIAAAMAYLHSEGVLHGDLSCNNVLLTSSDKDARSFTAMVADFGLARVLAGQAVIQTLSVGTLTHQPPEMLLEGRLTKAVDVYSFGVLLWEMANHRRAWQGLLVSQVVYQVGMLGRRLGPLPPGMPPAYQALVAVCLDPDSAKRPGFGEIGAALEAMLSAEALADGTAA